jgi:uncharacterized Zn-binding protein involved in type VI secretion
MGHKDNSSYDDHAAAFRGSLTQHKQDTITGGSPDVFINHQPAWRADVDVVVCKDDGPEKVTYGSDSVKINGFEAVRQFDVALAIGGGPFDPIVDNCSPDVSIGQTGDSGGIGEDADEAAKAYCEELCQLCKDWSKLNSDQRRERAEQLFHNAQARSGVFPTNCTWDDDPKDENGNYITEQNGSRRHSTPSFDQGNWHLSLPKYLLDKDDLKPNDFGGNGYHESRHAEQSTYALRYRATKEDLGPGLLGVERLHYETGVPRDVCRDALSKPKLDPKSPEYKFGEVMDNVNNGKGQKNAGYAEWKASPDAKEQQDGTLYHQLPNEKDARLVGYAGDCKGCC